MPGEMGDDFYVLRQGEASVTVHTTKGDKVGAPFLMLHLLADTLEKFSTNGVEACRGRG